MSQLHRYDVCTSTQDEAFALAAAGAAGGTAVVAAVQTGGRGSRGQRWASPIGGLWLSVLLRPTTTAAPDLVSIRAGLVVAEALATFGELPPVQLKWPNDLLIEGRKIGGVLVEAQWSGAQLDALVVGVGLNVQNVPPADARWPADRLAAWLPAMQVEAVLRPLLPALRALDTMPAALTTADRERFARRDALRGVALAAPLEGTGDGIAPDGQLRVVGADGVIRFLRSGPVVLAPVRVPA